MPKFTRDFLGTLRADIDAALFAVSQKHKVGLTIGRITFRDTEASARLSMCSLDAPVAAPVDPTALRAKEEAAFAALAVRVGLKADDYGRTVHLGRQSFTLCALKPQAPRFPVIGRTIRGAEYKLPLHEVLAALGRPVVPVEVPLDEVMPRGGAARGDAGDR